MEHFYVQSDLNQIGRGYAEIFNNRTRAYTAATHLTEVLQRDATLGQLPITALVLGSVPN